MLKFHKYFTELPPTISQNMNFRRDFSHQLVLGISMSISSSIATIIVLQSLNGDPQLAAWIQAGIMSGLLGSLVYVKQLQKKNPAKAYATPHLAAWFGVATLGLIDDPLIFTATTFLCSLLFAISMPFQGVLYQLIFERSVRGKIVSFGKQWQMLVTVLFSWLLGFMLERDPFSYRFVFPAVGLLGIFSSLRALKIKTPEKTKEDQPKFSLLRALSILYTDRNFSLFMGLQFVLGITNLAGVSALQVYINDANYLAASPEKAALLTGMIPPLAMFFSLRLWGGIFDRISIVSYRALTSLTMALGFVIYPLFNSFEAALLGAIIWGLGRGGGQLAWSIGVLAFTKEENASEYMGVHTFLTGIRGVFAPFIGISLLQNQLSAQWLCWIVAGMISLTAALTMLWIKNPELPNPQS